MKVRDDIPKMRINESSTSCDELEIVEALNAYFALIFTTEYRTHIPNLQENKYKRDIFISENRVEGLLSSLEQQKFQGSGDIHPAILKMLSRKLSYPLTIIFRESFKNSEVSEDWKLANVTPIHKQGPKNLVQNYKPISQTSQACRVMEAILKEEMLASLQESQVI